MVNRLVADSMALLASMKGTDEVSLGLLCKLQGLMAGQEGGLDPADVSKLVKTILDAAAPTVPKEGALATHTIILIPTSAQLTPTKTAEPAKGETSLLSPKTDKMDPKNPNQVETAVVKEKVTEKIVAQKPEGMQQQHRTEESGHKSQHLSLSPPIQQAVKEVLKAQQFIAPQNNAKGVEKADPQRSTASPGSQIQPAKETKESELSAKKQEVAPNPQKAPQADSTRPVLVKSEAKRLEENGDKMAPKTAILAKEEVKQAAQVISRPQVPLERKGAELLQNLGFKGTPLEQTNNQPRPMDRNSIPIAPYQAQFSTAESRRKEKRKYPHYFSDREEGEDEPENNDPKQKKK